VKTSTRVRRTNAEIEADAIIETKTIPQCTLVEQTPETETVSEKIRRLRKENGLTQVQLAEMIPTPVLYVSNFELNKTVPNREELFQSIIKKLEAHVKPDKKNIVPDTAEKNSLVPFSQRNYKTIWDM